MVLAFVLTFAFGPRSADADVAMPALFTVAQLERLDAASRSEYYSGLQKSVDLMERLQGHELLAGWDKSDSSRPAACVVDGLVTTLTKVPRPASCSRYQTNSDGALRETYCWRVKAWCAGPRVLKLGSHELRCRRTGDVPCHPFIH